MKFRKFSLFSKLQKKIAKTIKSFGSKTLIELMKATSKALAPKTPTRKSRRNAGEQPEFEPGPKVVTRPTSADQSSKEKSDQRKAESSKAKEKVEAPRDSTSFGNVDEQESPEVEEEVVDAEATAEPAKTTEPHETNEEFERFENLEEKDGDVDEESKFVDGEYNPFSTVTSSNDPVTHEQFEFFVARIGDIVEDRLKAFVQEAASAAAETTEEAKEPSKVRFADPVKPSTVENLPVKDKPVAPKPLPTRVDHGKARSGSNSNQSEEWENSPEYIAAMAKWNQRNKNKVPVYPSKPKQPSTPNKQVTLLSDEGFNLSYLNPWEKPGLNIVADATLAKLAQSERTYKIYDDQGDLKAKYNCKSDTFEKFRIILKEKVDRMAMRGIMTVVTASGENFSLVDRGQTITHEEMLDHKDNIWYKSDFKSQGECDKYNDARLKSHILGEWLLDSLTDSAKMKIMATQKEWMLRPTGNIHMQSIGCRYHGPLIYWHIVRIVKPNNDTLIEKAKKELKSLSCKKFNDDVVSMLIQFESKVDEIIMTLGGSMTEDEKVNTMWDAVLTSRDHEFKRRINDMRRQYRKTPVNQREPIENLIQEIKEEQINMAADGIFNQPDKSRDHTLALTSIVEKLVDKVNSKSSSAGRDRSRRQIPEWKYKREGNETVKTNNGTTYYWCKYHKGPNGEKEHGMWCTHREEDHKFGKASSESRGSGNGGNGSKGDSSKPSNDNKEGTITVDRKLFSAIRNNSNVTSFLSKLKDDTSSVKA